MYNKKLVTAAISMSLLAAACMTGNITGALLASAEQTEVHMEATASETKAAETAPPETKAAETAPPETKAPETAPPETKAPETAPPETTPPETAPPETTPPETSSPETPPSETTPSETLPPESETQPGSEGETQLPSQSENQTETGSVPSTEPMTPGETQTESEGMESESETQTEDEADTEEETDPELEEESESETSEYGSNEELIAHQNIVIPPKVELEFRFTQIEKRYALVKDPEGASVYEKKDREAREVGALDYYGLCYILDDAGDGWYYIESGNVRGFVQSEDVATDEIADRIVKVKGLNELPTARLTVARTENEAFTYTHTTVQEVLASKVYAVASHDLEIHEHQKESSRVTGTLQKGGLCYILADAEKDWIFVESGDVRGFVKKNSLITGSAACTKVSGSGEVNMALADLKIEPKDNKACYYTLTSVQKASQGAKTREAMVNFALQFVGNPYVWGGTSLTNGCDCSGYVQSIYAYFGYSLPRVADAQSVYGMQIPISSAEPGDLIFYAKNGYVYHVSMYIGNGRVVHAAGRKVGIITSGISGNAVWATRIITG